ncbi:phosphoethanolamine transferase [Campylobacter vulpis]|uniref:phosphoethanolamine transferase n=1 Tax=Campylobacter vulpis TaxID=1655500 RepID=UPI000C161EAD|nr:phosphoethanolamine--lipid A transferase [Campylobacter vulpis]MBS4275388.1 phosphoethanolamine transferase [Campylobacter vulpis]MBS4306514.1 phosphoethanolamine transferase [Campylobacter vulpis]MBS4313583.1 phosphoethanolamine transferase [Campylobacter vulpis]MBS4329703.1 phosphoethanolamine transferase [Campylobacter vulpis]MBS4406574.1 phosphoethanolamine transferase [Campylobacter vulpis]
MKISWFQFVFLNTFLIVLMNFNGFIFIYKNLSSNQLWLTIAIILAYACLVHIILCVIFVRFLSKFFSIIFLITAGMSAYFMQSYGVLIDSDMLRNVFNTDTKEAFDLINMSLILLILGLLFVSFFILKITILYPSFKKQLGIKFLNIFLAFGIFCAVFLPLTKSFVPFFRTYSEMRMYNVPFYQFYALFRYYQIYLAPKAELKILSDKAYRENNTTKRNLVLVIGETARAANYSLGGYKNQTNLATPHEDIIYFDKVSSCGTSTAVSLPCMFSASKKNNFSNKAYEENLLDFVDKVGIKTTWLDNNSGGCQGVCQRLKQTHIFKEEYDGFLIEELKKTLANLDTANFIIVHLQGSHGPAYYKRYPKEFEKFTPTCDTNELSKCTLEQITNTYDNTILYTDYIVEEMIDELKMIKDYQNTLIYISDHGESLGENGIYLHGMPYAIAPKTQTQIPFILWTDDENLRQIAFKHKNMELSHDNLFSTILGYFEVKTPFYEEAFDLLNLKFGEKK